MKMKHLFSLIIMMLVYIFSYQATAQTTTDICNLQWWQQLTQNNVSINENDITLSTLYRSCDEDENTPLMIAYFAGVNEEIVTEVLDIAVANTIRELRLIRNTHRENFTQMFFERHGPDTNFAITTSVQLRIRASSEEAYLSPSPFSGNICNTSWWQQLEGEDNALTKDIQNINIDDLFKDCSDGDKPLITALRANVPNMTITRLLETATQNTLNNLFNLEHARGNTLRTAFLRRHNPEFKLSFNVGISIHTITK